MVGVCREGIERMMKNYLLIMCWFLVWPLAAQQEERTDFIRVDEGKEALRLQTGITRYRKGGVTVDLIGAVHIADGAYFKQLNKSFKDYEVVLYEMVGGGKRGQVEKKPVGEAGEAAGPAEGKVDAQDPMMQMLGSAYALVSKLLKLEGQKEMIDYEAANLVHADLSLEEFEKLQQEKGESLLGFALQNGQQKQAGQKADEAGAAAGLDVNKLMMALMRGNANGIKREIIGSLGEGDDQVAALAGDSVIIGDRNRKCLQVLGEQVKKGRSKLGIFYGAAHFPDMERRLLADGYRKEGHQWLTAWNVPKAGAGNVDQP